MRNQTFNVINDVVRECTGGLRSTPGRPSPGVFKDNTFHIGGDEVSDRNKSTRALLQSRESLLT